MKHVVSVGLLLVATSALGQAEIGLTGPEALAPILAELEAIAPVCGMSTI